MKLERFIKAQESSYETALKEIRCGRKRSHWMWYIFPQIKGLGYSSTAQYYAIQSREEAEQYMKHPILAKRLIEISEALLKCESNDASEIFGYPDDMKIRVDEETGTRVLISEIPGFGNSWYECSSRCARKFL